MSQRKDIHKVLIIGSGPIIIGQAAVDANLVSPIVVIVVAFTALCSFAVPNEEFATAFRLLKFVLIGLTLTI